MARNNDRYGIRTIRSGHSADRGLLGHNFGQRSVGGSSAMGNRGQRIPNPLLEVRSDQTQRYIEGCSLPCEVCVELRLGLLDHNGIPLQELSIQACLNALVNSRPHAAVSPIGEAELFLE